jgi:hypothetical protein
MKMGIDKVKVTKGNFVLAIIDKSLIHLVNLDNIINVKNSLHTWRVTFTCISFVPHLIIVNYERISSGDYMYPT